jgi:inner membrane protein
MGRPVAVIGLAFVAFAMTGALDAVLTTRTWPVPAVALMDESAHLLTAGLILTAVLPVRALPIVPWTLAASVLIDLDHVPLYLFSPPDDLVGGRPVTHSLGFALALALAGAAVRGRLRTALLGSAAGVALHLVRDLATPIHGPGVRLLWPVIPDSFTLPYAGYAAGLAAVLAFVAVRQWRR